MATCIIIIINIIINNNINTTVNNNIDIAHARQTQGRGRRKSYEGRVWSTRDGSSFVRTWRASMPASTAARSVVHLTTVDATKRLGIRVNALVEVPQA